MVANIGSSHGECDFVYDDLEKQGITGFNFGIQAQTIEYDERYLITLSERWRKIHI